MLIETPVDKFIELLKKRGKTTMSEASILLKVERKQVEKWINTLEDRGIIELKYPVMGEPKIILKGISPEEIEMKMKKPKIKKEVSKEEKPVEKPKVKIEKKREEVKPKIGKDMVKEMEEKIEKDLVKIMVETKNVLSQRVKELNEKIEKLSSESKLEHQLFEYLLTLAGLKDVNKISIYLENIEKTVNEMKNKKLWGKREENLTFAMLRGIGEDWKSSGEKEIVKLFRETVKKI